MEHNLDTTDPREPISFEPRTNVRTAAQKSRSLLTIPEVCAQLRVSRWMIYRLIHTRQLKTVKIGRRRCIAPDDLQALIDQLRRETG